jgi:aryl-alcohol dehydrogenase-like predicted oxidoreductase
MHAHFKREDHCIISKVSGPGGMHWIRGGPVAVDGRNILEALEGSLLRLQVDCVDCYLIHWPDRCDATLL